MWDGVVLSKLQEVLRLPKAATKRSGGESWWDVKKRRGRGRASEEIVDETPRLWSLGHEHKCGRKDPAT